jgi:hypothetical protein
MHVYISADEPPPPSLSLSLSLSLPGSLHRCTLPSGNFWDGASPISKGGAQHALPYASWPQSAITTAAEQRPESEPTASTARTTSRPAVTDPNTTCLPSSHSVCRSRHPAPHPPRAHAAVIGVLVGRHGDATACATTRTQGGAGRHHVPQAPLHGTGAPCPRTLAVHRKNWEPLVWGPALAMDSTPGPVCCAQHMGAWGTPRVHKVQRQQQRARGAPPHPPRHSCPEGKLTPPTAQAATQPQHATLCHLQREVLVTELVAVDGLAAGAVAPLHARRSARSVARHGGKMLRRRRCCMTRAGVRNGGAFSREPIVVASP